ncbi:MAG: ComF family protein [Planctomycetes bacterium]|nr:ComF family protein [Planctomycetota bacterium]
MKSLWPAIPRRIRMYRHALVDTLWPPSCHGCGGEAAGLPNELCIACMAPILSPMQQAYCSRCGHSTGPFETTEEGCSECRGKRGTFERVFRVAAYRDGFAELFRKFKYRGHENLELFFARCLSREILQSEQFETIDGFVPVPSCWQHRLRRNFHPADGLAKLLAKHTTILYAPLLDRIRGGPSQVGLSRDERLRNVRGKFRLARGCDVRGGRVCLVDDIMTTGATTRECAKVLRQAGAAEVCVAIVARAGEDPATLQVV